MRMHRIMSKLKTSLYIGLFSGLFLLQGCAQLVQKPVGPVVQTPKVTSAWNQRKLSLARNNNWSLNSKIALSYREEHWQFGLEWAQQTARKYAMQIKNPLTGALVAKLMQNERGATLLANDGKSYRSKNAEHLLQTQANVNMPLNGMQFWVRGITAPQYKVDKLVLDNQGRPKFIQQAGWLIQYPGYQKNGYNALPKKILFKRTKDDVSVKLITKQWQGI